MKEPSPETVRNVVGSREAMHDAVTQLIDHSLAAWPAPEGPMAIELAQHSFRSFIERIDAHAGSAIERMLYNSMLIGFAVSDPFGIFVLDAQSDTQATIRYRREIMTAIYSVRKQAKGTPKTVDGYIDWLEASGRIGHEEADGWRSNNMIADLIGDAIHMIPQATFPAGRLGSKAIRADAVFFSPLRPKFRVVVECDGYEWHGNKDSFTSDRQRDRALKTAGYEVLRFSGSEIFNNPTKASMDLFGQLRDLKKAARVDKKWREVVE